MRFNIMFPRDVHSLKCTLANYMRDDKVDFHLPITHIIIVHDGQSYLRGQPLAYYGCYLEPNNIYVHHERATAILFFPVHYVHYSRPHVSATQK